MLKAVCTFLSGHLWDALSLDGLFGQLILLVMVPPVLRGATDECERELKEGSASDGGGGTRSSLGSSRAPTSARVTPAWAPRSSLRANQTWRATMGFFDLNKQTNACDTFELIFGRYRHLQAVRESGGHGELFGLQSDFFV